MKRGSAQLFATDTNRGVAVVQIIIVHHPEGCRNTADTTYGRVR